MLMQLLLPVYTIMIIASIALTISLVFTVFVSVWTLFTELCSKDIYRLHISLFYTRGVLNASNYFARRHHCWPR